MAVSSYYRKTAAAVNPHHYGNFGIAGEVSGPDVQIQAVLARSKVLVVTADFPRTPLPRQTPREPIPAVEGMPAQMSLQRERPSSRARDRVASIACRPWEKARREPPET
jgi:hypothetical protein